MIFNFLLLLVPVSLGLVYFHAPPLWVFITASVAIVPLAEWIRRGTEQLAEHTSSVVGGLLNVTFGNSAELILALFVLRAGASMHGVVKATITGSIIGNSLLGLGLAIVVGSSIQVALLTAPLLVLLSYAMGHPMNLVFSNPLELIAIAGVAFAVNSIAQDGETTWFEGLLLIAVYALLALAFFFVTP